MSRQHGVHQIVKAGETYSLASWINLPDRLTEFLFDRH